MRFWFFAASVLGACVGITTLAQATPITGELSLTGYASSIDTDSQTITFDSGSNLSTNGETGSFTELGSSNDSVIFDNQGQGISYASLTADSNLFCGQGCIYTASGNGDTTTFDLTSETISLANDTLTIQGDGTATLTGFAATPGTFELTAQVDGSQEANISFSTTTTAIPEPTSLALLGAGLLGFGLIRRRRSCA